MFVPAGIARFKDNASGASGQMIADTIQVQSGGNSISSVTYNPNFVAPVPGPAHLIE
jgi:hypothetical protein